MKNRKDQLSSYSHNKRQAAMRKYKVIRPNLAYQKFLLEISEDEGIPLRTLQCWKKHYQDD